MRKKTKSPCLNCPDRQLGCHSRCEKYIEFQKVHLEEKAMDFEERRQECEYWSLRRQSRSRAINARGDYERFRK